jgi:hypothetical protein
MSMKFEIRDVLYVTTAVAVLVAFARFWFAGFLITFVLANALLIFCPFAILFTTIIFADQRGQMLDLNTNQLYKTLKRVWLLSILCAAGLWLLICTAPFIVW